MSTRSTDLPRPSNEQDFENLCLDLFEVLWDGAAPFGRRGHEQLGIDIFGETAEGPVAAQCKKREGKLTATDVDHDAGKAGALDPKPKRLIFVTTAARDPKLQKHVRARNAAKKFGFPLEVWFWDDICRKLDDDEGLRARWVPRLLGQEEPPLVDVERLPSTILPRLIGREAELDMLEDAWRDPEIRVQSVVAVGGAGKTALVHHWLQSFEDPGWKSRGAMAAYAWSFYSQGGGGDRQASGDAFIDTALRFFGENHPPSSARDRGLRLAELVRRRRTLMVLDGLEPLQHPPASAQAGRVKDSAVAALIRALAADNPGLLVITTREPVADLASRQGRGARSHDLERLSVAAGVELLHWLKVKGPDHELAAVVAEVHGHAFTLTLVGTFLRDAHHGDVRAWKDVQLLDAAALIHNEQASKVMAAYAHWFDEVEDGSAGFLTRMKQRFLGRQASPERQLLAILGLFDCPADTEAVEALCQAPAIPSLADRLVGLGTARRNVALKRLRRARLLLEPNASGTADGALDAHPLVREHFGLVLEGDAPDSYRAGHSRLYEHYAAATDDLPATLEAMQPLYLAIGHGCRAGRRLEVYDEVYRRRVLRGNEFFSSRKLGAMGSNLTALAGFFESPWDRPATDLRQSSQAFLLNEAGFYLRALGRLIEAVEPTDAAFQMAIAEENWKNGALGAINLSELTLTVGQVARAVEVANKAVELADRSGELGERMISRTTLGNALHAAGKLDDAETTFREAEALQVELQPQYPKLFSVRGYQFCDLLLSHAAPLDGSALGRDALASAGEDSRRRCEEVRERADLLFKWRVPGDSLLDIALDHLSLGRATLGLALATAGDLDDVAEPLNATVHGLRDAAAEHHLPRGLIARATLHRFRGDVTAAEADLEEALDIAERGSMKLHECDARLEWARLRLAVEDAAEARRHLEAARALMTSTGYRRREREVEELTQALAESEPA